MVTDLNKKDIKNIGKTIKSYEKEIASVEEQINKVEEKYRKLAETETAALNATLEAYKSGINMWKGLLGNYDQELVNSILGNDADGSVDEPEQVEEVVEDKVVDTLQESKQEIVEESEESVVKEAEEVEYASEITETDAEPVSSIEPEVIEETVEEVNEEENSAEEGTEDADEWPEFPEEWKN